MYVLMSCPSLKKLKKKKRVTNISMKVLRSRATKVELDFKRSIWGSWCDLWVIESAAAGVMMEACMLGQGINGILGDIH